MKLSRLHLAAAVVAACVAAVVLYVILAPTVHAPPPLPDALRPLQAVETPQKAPDLSLVDQSGARIRLASLMGQPVLLNLWASWCAPCVKELPALARLQHVMGSRIKVLAVDVGRDQARDAQAFLEGHQARELQVFLDPDRSAMRALQATGLPLSVLFDADGHEIARALGAVDWDSPAGLAWFEQLANRPQPKMRAP